MTKKQYEALHKKDDEGMVNLNKISHVMDKLDSDDRRDLLNFILDLRLTSVKNNIKKKGV